MQLMVYCKIPKISPGLTFFKGPFWGAYFWRGLYSEGLMYGRQFAFKNRLVSLILGRKFTIFLWLLCIWGQFPSTSSPGAYIWRGNLMEGFFALRFWGAYIRRGLYMEGLIFWILQYYKFILASSLKERDILSMLFPWIIARPLERL